MIKPEVEQRSHDRRARDEQIAAEPPLPPVELPPDAIGAPVERQLAEHHRHPLAVVGVVENGLVRPLDPSVKLAENSRVIIVAASE
jgi:hypothetical protein